MEKSKRKRSSLDPDGKENTPQNADGASKRGPGATKVNGEVESGDKGGHPGVASRPGSEPSSASSVHGTRREGRRGASRAEAGQAGQGTTAYEGEGKQGRRGEGYRRGGQHGQERARGASDIDAAPEARMGRWCCPWDRSTASPWSTWGRSSPRTRRGSTPRRTSLPVGYRTTRQYMRCDDPNGPPHEVGPRDLPRRGGRRRQAAVQAVRGRGPGRAHRRQVGHCGLGGGARARRGGPEGQRGDAEEDGHQRARVLRLLPPSHPSSHRRTAGGEAVRRIQASPRAKRHRRRGGTRGGRGRDEVTNLGWREASGDEGNTTSYRLRFVLIRDSRE